MREASSETRDARGSPTPRSTTVSVGVGGASAGPESRLVAAAGSQTLPSGACRTVVKPPENPFLAGSRTCAPFRAAASSSARTSLGWRTTSFRTQPGAPVSVRGSGVAEADCARAAQVDGSARTPGSLPGCEGSAGQRAGGRHLRHDQVAPVEPERHGDILVAHRAAQASWLTRTRLPAGSRKAQSRTP